MSVVLQQVLAAEDLARVREGLAAAQWRSGKRTAGATARDIKDNLQADSSDARVQALETFVAEALRRHPLFEIAARPARLTRVMFSRYEPGMTYGAHTDDALMGGSDDRIRTDLAFTIFLEARDAYDGGALVVQSALGDQEIRLDAGDAIVYPAGSIHYVSPVTRGARLAAVGWIESFVADAAQRETLFDLSIARARMADANASRGDLLLLDKSISNLLRMWAR